MGRGGGGGVGVCNLNCGMRCSISIWFPHMNREEPFFVKKRFLLNLEPISNIMDVVRRIRVGEIKWLLLEGRSFLHFL